MALKLKRNFVVLFQSDPASKENKYIKIIEKENVIARSISTISFNFVNNEKLQDCLSKYDNYAGIIFTSTRAVTAVSLSFLKLNYNCTEQWKKKRNFSVGNATANSAASLLNLDTYGADSGNSEKLCELIISMCGDIDKPFLFPCSQIRKDTIPVLLSEKGIAIEDVVCYETVSNEQFNNLWQNLISKDGLPNILVFFSPSGVQSCIDIIKNTYERLPSPNFIAIGPSTQKALSEAGILCKTTEKPSPECVMDIIKDLINI